MILITVGFFVFVFVGLPLWIVLIMEYQAQRRLLPGQGPHALPVAEYKRDSDLRNWQNGHAIRVDVNGERCRVDPFTLPRPHEAPRSRDSRDSELHAWNRMPLAQYRAETYWPRAREETSSS